MIWAILAALGVPLWLCAIAIATLVFRNRSMRKRGGDVPCRLRRAPGKRWTPGHALWVHDVLAFRGSPAAWKEDLLWVRTVALRPARPEDGKLWRLGEDPVIATLTTEGGQTLELAADARYADALPMPPTAAGPARPAVDADGPKLMPL